MPIPKLVAKFETTLVAGLDYSTTTMTLSTVTSKNGTVIPAGTYGFVIDEGTADEEYVLAIADGSTSVLTGMTRGLSYEDGATAVGALAKAHRKGAQVKITDHPVLMVMYNRSASYIGSYSAIVAYSAKDMVTYDGQTYICKLASTGNLPTNGTYWDVMAVKGGVGPEGPTGPAGADSTVPGPQGPDGPQGNQGIQGIQGIQGPAGTGDVNGPASSVDSKVVMFNGTTGKLIKDSGLSLSGSNTGDQTSIVGITGTLAQFNTAVTDADIAPVASPVFTGLVTLPSFSLGVQTIATAGGTTTFTASTVQYTVFTGTQGQTVVLPNATTLTVGRQFYIDNDSTQAITVNVNGGAGLWIVAPGTDLYVTCLTIGTAAGTWESDYMGSKVVSGKKLSVNNTITLAGTDSTTMTFPATSATIARTDAANTFTGVQTMTSPNFTTPVLGTPSSGTLTSCTGLPVAGLVASTTQAIGVGSVELGHASDTTIARVSAGVISVEGVTIPTISSTSTLTNKRVNQRVVSATSYTTDTGTSLDVSTCDLFVVTAQAGALKLNNPSGTPVEGQKLMVRIKDNGTARALTYDTYFRAMGVALPSTTVLSKTVYLGFIYNSTDTKWDLVSVAQEA